MLKKLFIKDYLNTNDIKVKIRYGLTAGIFGIIVNLFLGTIKLLLGLFTNSITIIADAFNNVTDMTSSILTIIGFKLSSKKSSQYNQKIYMKYEYLSSILISILMLTLGIIFLFKSINKIINPEDIIINLITFTILLISLILKSIQYIVLKDFAQSINSKTLKTNSLETKNDIITNISILISMIIMKILNINIDGYLGLIVSLFIIYISSTNIKKEVQDLVIKNKNEKKNEMRIKLLSDEYINGLHNLIIHTYKNNNYMTIHIEIDDKTEFSNILKYLDKIEKEVEQQYSVNLTIHINPISKLNNF